MNEKILKFFEENPPVYAGSTKAFWDDEHISKGMLAAHLDAEHDGASRKLETIQSSVEWLCEYCGDVKGKRLLDLGCGPGLYAEMLCDRGFSVTGVDFSRRSIEYARNQAEIAGRDIDYIYQNYLELDFDNEFDAAIMVYYDYGVLPPKDREVLLEKVHRALKRDGILILDVYNMSSFYSFREAQSVSYEKSGFWSPEPHVVIQRNVIYSETKNTLDRYLVMTGDSTDIFNIWDQYYSKETFSGELCKSYFNARDFYDDICGRPFTGQAEGICGVFSKR